MFFIFKDQTMVVIRLSRRGNKHRPFWFIVVADSRSPRDGRFIEKIGYHNPFAGENEEATNFDLARLEYWTKVGAQLSPTVADLAKKFKKAASTAA